MFFILLDMSILCADRDTKLWFLHRIDLKQQYPLDVASLNRRYGEVVLAAGTQFMSVNVAFWRVFIHWSAPRAFQGAGVVVLVNRWSFLRDRDLNKNEFLGCPLGQKCSHWGEAVVQRFPLVACSRLARKPHGGCGETQSLAQVR